MPPLRGSAFLSSFPKPDGLGYRYDAPPALDHDSLTFSVRTNYLLPADTSHHLQRLHTIFAADVVVCNESHLFLVNARRENVLLRQLAAEVCSVHTGAGHIEDQDIRRRALRINLDSLDLRQAFRQDTRIG